MSVTKEGLENTERWSSVQQEDLAMLFFCLFGFRFFVFVFSGKVVLERVTL